MAVVDCQICCKPIIEATEQAVGDEALQCEGKCERWLHRWCAGVHKDNYAALASSVEPFFCPSCRLHEHQQLISSLVATADELKEEIRVLKHEQVTSVTETMLEQEQRENATEAVTLPGRPSYASAVAPVQTTNARPTNRSQAAAPRDDRPVSGMPIDRKANIVVFGIEECAKGTPWYTRAKSDLESVSSILSDKDPSMHINAIKDCFRLGKFLQSRERPRPILVQMHRQADAHCVLASRKPLAAPLYIKPDLSPSDRANEAALLKVRWTLIQSGTDRKSIKIRGSKININGQLYGEMRENVFHKTPQ